jgi:hypothetical protein
MILKLMAGGESNSELGQYNGTGQDTQVAAGGGQGEGYGGLGGCLLRVYLAPQSQVYIR